MIKRMTYMVCGMPNMCYTFILNLIFVLCRTIQNIILTPFFHGAAATPAVTPDGSARQTWGYVTVRPGAHMFWWLYYTTATEQYAKRPLVLWLQGGPGASGTGFGNFAEIGPLDIHQNPRNSSWVRSFFKGELLYFYIYIGLTPNVFLNNTQQAFYIAVYFVLFYF
jgi:hypothetical protein